MSYQLYAQPVPTTGQSKPSNTGQTQTAETGTPKEGKKPDASPFAGMGSLLFPVLLIAVFYFLLIRPQQKKQKDQKKFIEAVKKGDQVVTVGGIHGKVFSVADETVTIEVDRGMKITLEKSSISLDASKRVAG